MESGAENRRTIKFDNPLASSKRPNTAKTAKIAKKPVPKTNPGTLRKALMERWRVKNGEARDSAAKEFTSSLSPSAPSVSTSGVPPPPEGKGFEDAVTYLGALVKKRREDRFKRKSGRKATELPVPNKVVGQPSTGPELVVDTQKVATSLPSSLSNIRQTVRHRVPNPRARTFRSGVGQPSPARVPPRPSLSTPSQRTRAAPMPVPAPMPAPAPAPAPMPAPMPAPAPAPLAAQAPTYSNLKGGSKPTYRQLFGKTLKARSASRPPLRIENQTETEVKSHRRTLLDEVKKGRAGKGRETEPSAEKGEGKPRTRKVNQIRRTFRSTKTKTFKLGRLGGRVGVLLKDQKTRKRVSDEHARLKRKNIKDVRQYLRDHNLMSAGSTVPNDVARAIFINSVLTGEVRNRNEKVALHNFNSKDD